MMDKIALSIIFLIIQEMAQIIDENSEIPPPEHSAPPYSTPAATSRPPAPPTRAKPMPPAGQPVDPDTLTRPGWRLRLPCPEVRNSSCRSRCATEPSPQECQGGHRRRAHPVAGDLRLRQPARPGAADGRLCLGRPPAQRNPQPSPRAADRRAADCGA